ncbi:MAG: GntR family transcriptional regulator [Polaromonas sp.]|nr:GntR family transcriptional regulator [Polaromonas sp.]
MRSSRTTLKAKAQPLSSPESPTIAAAQYPVSASELVFFGIVNGLELQKYVPAQRLVEADLAAQFGVGRNSVREALQRLAAEGIVDLHRHKGAAIRSLSMQETLDVLDVAERMTGLLARAAARGAASSGLKKILLDSLRALKTADAANDAATFTKARRRFYRCLLDMGGNRELQRLFPTIQMPIVYAQYRLPALQQLRLRDYGKIATAVRAGDPDAAEAAGAAHVQHVRQEIIAGSI